MTITIGSQLGTYEITALLGKGGMGEVYRARDSKLKREVAIKILPEEFSKDHDRVSRFQREAEVLASLNHSNIAIIYDLQETADSRFLVLELVEGETLAERIVRGALPVEDALSIAKQIAEALEAAHEKGVVHRDLKPANVKVLPDGKVKVLDFGLAKAMEGHSGSTVLSNSPTLLSMTATRAGVILGTVSYMSPEQANGFSADARSDIFSFGCVLYEMLTGRQSFQGQTASEVMASVLARDPDLRLLPANLHPRILHVLRRALEKNPKQRWQSSVDVRMELDAIVADPHGKFLAQASPSSRPLWKRAIPVVAASLVFTALGAIGALRMTPRPPAPITRFPFTLPQNQQFVGAGRQLLSISPDGTQFVYEANRRLYLKQMGELDSIFIQGTEDAQGLRNPVFSPDGRSIAFYSLSDLSFKRIAVSGGAAVTICHGDNPFGISWGPDDQILLGAGIKGILRVSANGGTPETIVKVQVGEEAYGPQILPGGDGVLFTLAKSGGADRWDKANIVVHSLRSGERKVLVAGGTDGRYVPTGHLVYALRGTLLAIPFDARRLEVKGGPTPIVEGVQASPTGSTGTSQFSFSEAGTLVYVPGGLGTVSPNTLALVDRNGVVKTLGIPPAPYVAPRISPNGKQVAFHTDDGKESIVWIYDLSGATSMRRLTFGGRNTSPIWSPNGERVFFTSDDNGLFSQRADGIGAAERVTKAENGYFHLADSWLTNNQVLSFSNIRNGAVGDTVWTYSMQDKKTASFADTPAMDVNSSSFSKDGRWLAYQSGLGAQTSETYVQPFPPSGAKYQITRDGGNPLWSGDGKELFFTSGSPSRLSSVSVQTQSGFTFANPVQLPIQGFQQALDDRRNYDITPDGKQFIMVFPPGQNSTESRPALQIQVILNWFEDLKKRVPVR